MARATTNEDQDTMLAQVESHSYLLRGWTLTCGLVGLSLAVALASLNQTNVGIALPEILNDLHGLDRITWIISSYLGAETVMFALAGMLSSRFGSKFVLIVGLVIFLTSAWFAAVSPAIVQLIIFRGLQGVGAGCILRTAFRSLGTWFNPSIRMRWQSFFVLLFGLFSALGPAIGTWLLLFASWRWMLFLNLPVGAVAALLLIFSLPADRPVIRWRARR